MGERTNCKNKINNLLKSIGERLGLQWGECESNFGNVEFELLLRYPSGNVK